MTPAARARTRARIQRIRRILNHPATLLTSAVGLFFTSLHEVIATAAESFELGAHHGVLLYSVLQAARAFPELLESAERAEEAALGTRASDPEGLRQSLTSIAPPR